MTRIIKTESLPVNTKAAVGASFSVDLAVPEGKYAEIEGIQIFQQFNLNGGTCRLVHPMWVGASYDSFLGVAGNITSAGMLAMGVVCQSDQEWSSTTAVATSGVTPPANELILAPLVDQYVIEPISIGIIVGEAAQAAIGNSYFMWDVVAVIDYALKNLTVAASTSIVTR